MVTEMFTSDLKKKNSGGYFNLKDFPDGRVKLDLILFVKMFQLAGVECSDWFKIS